MSGLNTRKALGGLSGGKVDNPLQITGSLAGLGFGGLGLKSSNLQGGIDRIRGKGPGKSEQDFDFAQRNPSVLGRDFSSFQLAGQNLASESRSVTDFAPKANVTSTLSSLSSGEGRVGQERIDALATIFKGRQDNIRTRRRQPSRAQTVLTSNRRTLVG